jgi:glycosyltransferase involved in cell wall biosynthesis
VLCVSAFADLGGAERCLLDTVACLSARRFEVEVLNLVDHPGALARALERRGIRVHVCRVGRFRDPRGAARAAAWFLRHARRFDVAIANDTRAALYTALGRAVRGTPYVWHVHDIVSAGQRLQRLAVRLRPAAWIANSRAVKSSLVRHGCSGERIAVVHNGVDANRFHPAAPSEPLRSELAVDASALLVGAIGRLVPWKGLEILLEAADRLRAAVPQAVYLVVGDAVTDAANRSDALRYREGLFALRDRLDLGARVRFLGERADMPRVMAGLDVLVHSATDEPFGLVLIEAMAAGKAVVAARGGGVTEIVDDGVTGYVVPPRDPEAVAHRLALLADRARRDAMGGAGRHRALAHFSLEAYGDALAAVVTRAVTEGMAADGRQ